MFLRSDQNLILRLMLEEDAVYKEYAMDLKPLMNEIWIEIEDETKPIAELFEQVKNLDAENDQSNLENEGQCQGFPNKTDTFKANYLLIN